MSGHDASVTQPIGVFGFGDLGQRLVAQLISVGYEVIVFDPDPQASTLVMFDRGLDPSIDVSDLVVPPLSGNPWEILSTCCIIHWAVPSALVHRLPTLSPDQTVILHDSVMANNRIAVISRQDQACFVFAHCLTNDERRVLIAEDQGDHQRALDHFLKIGLAPKLTSLQDHDALMARTQGVFALMIALGLRKQLDEGFRAGDLTPSALELREAVIKREVNWTEQTLQSILRNPELASFARELSSLLADWSIETRRS